MILNIKNKLYTLRVRSHKSGVTIGVGDPELEMSILVKTDQIDKLIECLQDIKKEHNEHNYL